MSEYKPEGYIPHNAAAILLGFVMWSLFCVAIGAAIGRMI